jgi:hypothetical protein
MNRAPMPRVSAALPEFISWTFRELPVMQRFARAVGIIAVLLAHQSVGSLAQGAVQNVTVSGTVLTADAGNLFGLNVGDPISLQATYDDTTGITYNVIPFDSSTTNLMTITLGSIQLTEANDVGFYEAPPAYPRLTLCNVPNLDVYAIDYITEFGTNSATVDYVIVSRTEFIAIDANGAAIMAEWNLSNCPEPSTWILVATAGFGIGLRRVRRRA